MYSNIYNKTYQELGINTKKPRSPFKDFGAALPMERVTRLELATHSLGSYCSTTELYPQLDSFMLKATF